MSQVPPRADSARSASSAPATTASFDAYYREARERLLVQTFALTGDLPAARRGVRETFVAAWHHWSKVGRLDDPDEWARPHAWTAASRRHTARPFHREKHLDDAVAVVLEALAELDADERRVLLLDRLAGLALPDLAREAGLTAESAHTKLARAAAATAERLGVGVPELGERLEGLGAATTSVRWPRHTIIRRAGTTRRRLHTGVGVAATVGALVLTGALVTDVDGVRPNLDRESATTSQPGARRTPPPQAPDLAESVVLTADDLDAIDGLAARRWSVTRTFDNSSGDGRALPCQGARYADASGSSLLVRDFTSGRVRATQFTEGSADTASARAAYDTATSWFAGCTQGRTQLLGTYDVPGTGDDALMFVLRDWANPAQTRVVGVARTGDFITATAALLPGTDPALLPQRRLLQASVTALCDQPGAGACVSGDAKVQAVAPLPLAEDPAMLGVVDLPPVSGIDRPWKAGAATKVKQNVAATRCDRASFTAPVGGVDFTRASTRTFLIPGPGLPPQFGLTETVGVLTPDAASAFVAQVRDRLASCGQRQIGTQVSRLASSSTAGTDLSVWRVTSQISVSRSVRYAMAILRDGARVAQVGFIAGPRADLSDDDVVALARRALDRLGELPTD